jgi:putative transposase
MYLVGIIDWYSRHVVSWVLADTLEMPFVLDATQRALALATPTISNMDQGSHFTSPQFLTLLTETSTQINMDGRGRALDNIFIERFWRSIKYEEIYLHDYATPREARRAMAAYIAFYNHERRHQSLDYATPASVYGVPSPIRTTSSRRPH